MISWKLTVEKILRFSGGLYVSSARSSWFTGYKLGTLFIYFFFCLAKPLYEQFLIELVVLYRFRFWRKNMKISSEQPFSLKKWRQITWGREIYHFPGKQWTFLGIFQVPRKIKNMVHTCVFKKITKMFYFWEKCKK